jgi:hypothetical protein
MTTDLLTFISGAIVTEEQKTEQSLVNLRKELVREHLIFLKRVEQPTINERKMISRNDESLSLSENVYTYLENEEFQHLLAKNKMNLVEGAENEKFSIVKDSKERKHRLKKFTELYARAVELSHIEKMEQGYKVEYKKLGSFFPTYTHTLLFDDYLQGLKYQLYHPQWKTVEEDLDIDEFLLRNQFNQQEVELVAQILKENIDHD